jgi:hypothetical protein
VWALARLKQLLWLASDYENASDAWMCAPRLVAQTCFTIAEMSESTVESSDAENASGDLGFEYTITKSEIVFVRHNGRQVTELRGKAADAFVKKVNALDFEQQQQYMARVTGNYKRGNERLASRHARNR